MGAWGMGAWGHGGMQILEYGDMGWDFPIEMWSMTIAVQGSGVNGPN